MGFVELLPGMVTSTLCEFTLVCSPGGKQVLGSSSVILTGAPRAFSSVRRTSKKEKKKEEENLKPQTI